MTDHSLLGPWVRRFLLEYLVTDRNLSRNTQQSYRDTLCLLIPFLALHAKKEVHELAVIDVSSDAVRLFLQHLEENRKCGVATRNQRLAAIHSLARFIGLHSPEHVAWSGQLRTIPSKRAPRSTITYLEKPEMDALLSAPDQTTDQGRRDRGLLLFSTTPAHALTRRRKPRSPTSPWHKRRVTTLSSRCMERETSCAVAHCGRKRRLNCHP